MLARLEKVSGVEQARVDWSGRKFLIKVTGKNAQIAREIVTALRKGGYIAQQVSDAPFVASLRKGDPWLRAGDTLRLSTRESEVLAKEWTDEVLRETDLTEIELNRVRRILQKECLDRFRGFHESGGIAKSDRTRLRNAFSEMMERAASSCSAYLDAKKAAGVRAVLISIVQRIYPQNDFKERE